MTALKEFFKENRVLAGAFLAILVALIIWKFFGDKCHVSFSQFGGFVGGVCGSIALIMVIRSYSIQSNQLNLAISNSKVDTLHKELDAITSEIENLTFTSGDRTFKGTEAILKIKSLEDLTQTDNVIRDALNSIVVGCKNLISAINNASIPQSTAEALKTRTYFLFYTKIFWTVNATIWKSRDVLQAIHDDSRGFFPTYAAFCRETYNYLRDNRYVSSGKEITTDVLNNEVYPIVTDQDVLSFLSNTQEGKKNEYGYRGKTSRLQNNAIVYKLAHLGLAVFATDVEHEGGDDAEHIVTYVRAIILTEKGERAKRERNLYVTEI